MQGEEEAGEEESGDDDSSGAEVEETGAEADQG
jgi:hypothetical protein